MIILHLKPDPKIHHSIGLTNSKGLPGVGSPRNAKPKDGDAIGWNYIKDFQTTPNRTILDTTLSVDQIERAITPPFTKCDRLNHYMGVCPKLNIWLPK